MNEVILSGRLTKDPELRYTAVKQTAVCRFILAVDRRTQEESADFIRVVAFGKTAENLSKYKRKGSFVQVAGQIRTGSYTSKKSGETIWTMEVMARSVEYGPRTDKDAKGEDPKSLKGPAEEMYQGFSEINDSDLENYADI